MRQIAGVDGHRHHAARRAGPQCLRAGGADRMFSPVDGVVRMNNRGTDQVGPAFMLGQFFVNGLLGRQEKARPDVRGRDRPRRVPGRRPVFRHGASASGTRVNALLFRSHSAPNEAPVNLDDEYTRERAHAASRGRCARKARASLAVSAAFDADDLTIDRDGMSSSARTGCASSTPDCALSWRGDGRDAVLGEPAAAQGPRRVRRRLAGDRSRR